MVADAFALAKEKKSTIIFINELDVIGEKWGRTEGEALESIAICLNFLTN
jgi:ATP-dependent 26S proteasome regulatory subunit